MHVDLQREITGSGCTWSAPNTLCWNQWLIVFFILLVYSRTAWRDITSGDFTVRMFDGSHFYLKDSENEKIILDYITKHLETSEMDYLWHTDAVRSVGAEPISWMCLTSFYVQIAASSDFKNFKIWSVWYNRSQQWPHNWYYVISLYVKYQRIKTQSGVSVWLLRC